MKVVRLVRERSDEEGTFGTLYLPTGEMFKTGELPWKDNVRGVSCIPEGKYVCALEFSPSFQKVLYHVENVKDRDGILIHAANWMGDTEKGFKSELKGCIALGKGLTLVKGQDYLTESRKAIEEFMNILDGENFILDIKSSPSGD